jgi:hypothetical protein
MPVLIPLVPFSEFVYTKEDITLILDQIEIVKADKVSGAVANNIAGLTGDVGNLLDTGYNINDLLIGEYADGGLFSDLGEL